MPSRELVIAACNDRDNIEELQSILKEFPDVKLTVYEKCDASSSYNLLDNVGREQHTFARHFASRYDDLADYTICSAGNFKKHPYRLEFIKKALRGTPSQFECIGGEQTVRDVSNFRIKQYEGNMLHPADPEGLEEWSKKHLGTHDPDATCCYYGVMVVPAASIRRRPKVDYENVKKALAFKDPEATHYMERLQAVLYDSQHLLAEGVDGTNKEAIHSNGSQNSSKSARGTTTQWRADRCVKDLMRLSGLVRQSRGRRL